MNAWRHLGVVMSILMMLCLLAVISMMYKVHGTTKSQAVFGKPQIVAVFRMEEVFDSPQTPLLSALLVDSVMFLHREIAELRILVLAESPNVVHMLKERLPVHDSHIQILLVDTRDGRLQLTKAVQDDYLEPPPDYVIFVPVSVRLNATTVSALVDLYWRAATHSGHVGAVSVPVVDYQYMVHCLSIDSETRVSTRKTCISQPGVSGPACCECDSISDSFLGSVTVVKYGHMASLPRPWLGPVNPTLLLQLKLHHQLKSLFCNSSFALQSVLPKHSTVINAKMARKADLMVRRRLHHVFDIFAKDKSDL